MRNWIIRKLRGFPDIDSAISYLREIDDQDKKREILTEAVKKLYTTIGEDDILTKKEDGSWTFLGRPLLSSEVAQLQQEAQLMAKTKLWYVIKTDIRYNLGRRMFEEARVKDDLIWGQAIVFLDEIIRRRIQKMKQ